MGGKGSGSTTNRRNAGEIDPDFNHRSITFTLTLNDLPDYDKGDPAATAARVREYFELCDEFQIRPLVGNFAVAMKLNKRTLWGLLNDERTGRGLGFTDSTMQLLKNAYNLIESNFEQVLSDSKNPVPNIYYTKAIFGWKEAANETIVTHRSEKQLQGSDINELATKYALMAGGDSEAAVYETPDSDSDS